MKKNIELLAPAGDLEKLKVAVLYGADAVYIGGQSLGLRARAKNFDLDDMREGVEFAHSHGVKVYVTANVFAHNDDLTGCTGYFEAVAKTGADALIISDPGVFGMARAMQPPMDVHISTQANTTNYQSALFWHKLGASRVNLARELSIDEIKDIRKNTSMELEVFVHGAMCVSYSGRCLLSNYMTGRDSNRGNCAHPCRYEYYLTESTRPGEYYRIDEDERGTYIFNSKDLCMIEYLPELLDAGVDSIKIEGRMKSSYYVGVVVGAYRRAIDDCLSGGGIYESRKHLYLKELESASHRAYTTGFYFGKPGGEGQMYSGGSYEQGCEFIGMVLDYDPSSRVVTVEQRNKFSVGDMVEFFTQDVSGVVRTQEIIEMYNEDGESVKDAPHAQQIIRFVSEYPLKPFDMLRK